MNSNLALDLATESTRERILMAAHEEMYEHGFQGLRIEAVLKKTNLAKGALYHYFPTKLALGYAVVDEVLLAHFNQTWNEFFSLSKDPLLAIQDIFRQKCADVESGECANGCPISNLVQEMSTLDEGFHQRLVAAMLTIVATVATALKEGQEKGIVKPDVDPQRVASFLMSSYQGIMGVTKCMKSGKVASDLFGTLSGYVESLRVDSTQ